MPGKNTVKELYADGYYHVYNRGVAKQKIFCKREDYVVFLRFLKEYLLPLNHVDRIILQGINPRRRAISLHGEVQLLAYCLMPNHFHLLVRNLSKNGLSRFMKAISTNYAMYFNHEYKRVGPLFQGIYKAVEISDERYYMWITRYIHRNPRDLLTRDQPLSLYEFSSYPAYLGRWKADWLDSDEISGMFSQSNPRATYKNFVEGSVEQIAELEPLYLGLDD
jgi:putative transposase